MLRKRIRTVALGIIACGALFWGAIDIVGVPPGNLLALLGQVILGLLGLIGIASAPAYLMSKIRLAKKRSQ